MKPVVAGVGCAVTLEGKPGCLHPWVPVGAGQQAETSKH